MIPRQHKVTYRKAPTWRINAVDFLPLFLLAFFEIHFYHPLFCLFFYFILAPLSALLVSGHLPFGIIFQALEEKSQVVEFTVQFVIFQRVPK